MVILLIASQHHVVDMLLQPNLHPTNPLNYHQHSLMINIHLTLQPVLLPPRLPTTNSLSTALTIYYFDNLLL